MSTRHALERVARDNPRLGIVHSNPGPVTTAGLIRAMEFGMWLPDQMSQDDHKRSLCQRRQSRPHP